MMSFGLSWRAGWEREMMGCEGGGGGAGVSACMVEWE